MKHEYRVFPNGLRLVVNKTDSKLACVLVRVLSGIEHEKKREEGITSLVEKLLACGTKSYPSRKSLKSQIDSFGGILSVSAFLDCIEIAIQVMENNIEKAVDVLSEIVFEPLIRPVDFATARKEQILSISADANDANLLSHDSLRGLVFVENGLSKSIFGRKSALEKLTAADVRQYWESVLNPKNVIVSVSGDIDIDKVYDCILKMFYSKFLIAKGKAVKPSDAVAVVPKNAEERSVSVTKRLNQSRVSIGFWTDGVAFGARHTTLLLAQLIDKKMSEKFEEIDGAYVPECKVRLFAKNGLLCLSFAADNEKLEHCVVESAKLVLELVQNGWTNAEFLSEREIYKTKFAQYLSSIRSLSRMSARVLAQTDITFDFDSELVEIDQVSQSDCIKLLRSIVVGKPFVSIVGPKQDATKILTNFENVLKGKV